MRLQRTFSRGRAKICSTFVASFFFQWTELPFSSSESRLRCEVRDSPEGHVPTLTQEHQLRVMTDWTAYTLQPRRAVDQDSEPFCSEVIGLTTPTWDQSVTRIYCLNFFPSWRVVLKMKYRCNKSLAASLGGDSFRLLTHEWQNRERDLMSSLMLAPSRLAGKQRESQMKASCWAHWIILLSNTHFTHSSRDLKADGFGCSSPACKNKQASR